MRGSIFLIVLFASATASAQTGVSFTQHPEDLQLYPRNEVNEGFVLVEGTVSMPDQDSIIFELYRNDLLISRVANELVYENEEAPLNHIFTIASELALYDVRTYLDADDVETMVSEASDIVAGDAYIIHGQSNAWAEDYDGAANFSSPYLRTLGRTAWYNQPAPSDATDDTWYLGQGTTSNTQAAVGVYGLELARIIIENHQIPVALFNGSGGGGDITNYFRNDSNPQDINTVYGRLLYRVDKAKLSGDIKGIVWNQGESENSSSQYEADFDGLYSDLMEDYPNTQKVYLFQTPPGCVNNPQADALREVQRNLPSQYENMRIMSRCNLPGHDYDFCHYHFEGYSTMAFWTYRQMSEDFYSTGYFSTIDPPNLIYAEYMDGTNTSLSLQFDQYVEWNESVTSGSNTYYLKDHIYLDGEAGLIESAYVDGTHVILELYSASQADKVSYTPNKYYNGTSETYEGPWIVGLNEIGALAFHDFSIAEATYGVSSPTSTAPTFEVHPNPISENLSLSLNLPSSTDVRISLVDVKGAKVKELHSGSLASGEHTLNFPLTEIPTGVYFIKVTTENYSDSLRVVIANNN
jgi:hypothetical protein